LFSGFGWAYIFTESNSSDTRRFLMAISFENRRDGWAGSIKLRLIF
jgi:hypothetical protein